MDLEALRLSALLASVTTLACLALGLPLAWWLVERRTRWRAVIEALVGLPMVLPPTVLGFYLLVSFGPRGALGRVWMTLFDRPLAFSFSGLWLASVITTLPFAVQPFVAAFAAVDRRLIEAAWCLGASRWRAFWQVALPLAAPGVMGGAVLAFAHTLGEFGVVLMVGGNIAGRTRTLSIALFDAVEQLDDAAANQTALFLLCVAFAVLVTTARLRPREVR